MNVVGSRSSTGKPKTLTREDFEKNQQKAAPKDSKDSKNPSKATTSSTITNASTTAPKKKRNKKNKKKEYFKLSIRLLPPNLKAEEFWAKTQDIINEQNILEKYYVQGKYSNKPFKLPTYSRAYVQFKKPALVDQFVAKYKETVFEDDKESLVPNFSKPLFNKVPDSTREYKKPKENLEDLSAYKTFLQFYNGEIERPTSFLIPENSKKDKLEKEKKKNDKKDEEEKSKDENKKAEVKAKRSKKRKAKKQKAEAEKAKDDKSIDATSAEKKDKPKKQRKSKAKKDKETTDQKPKEQSSCPKPKVEQKKKDTKPKDKKPKENKPKSDESKDTKPKIEGAKPSKMKIMSKDSSESTPKPKPMLLKRND